MTSPLAETFSGPMPAAPMPAAPVRPAGAMDPRIAAAMQSAAQMQAKQPAAAPARPAAPSPAQMKQAAMMRRQDMVRGPNRAKGGPVKAKKYAKGGAISTGSSKGTTMKTTVKRQFTLAKTKGSPSAASRGDGCAQRGRTKAKIV